MTLAVPDLAAEQLKGYPTDVSKAQVEAADCRTRAGKIDVETLVPKEAALMCNVERSIGTDRNLLGGVGGEQSADHERAGERSSPWQVGPSIATPTGINRWR
jgi:hypothetical protein